MREVLADALALTMRVQTRRVHTGGAGYVFQFAVHPVRGGDDGILRVVVLGDLLAHPRDAPAGGRVVRAGEHLVESVDHGLGLQVLPGDGLCPACSPLSVSTTDDDVTSSSVCGACRSNDVTAVPQ